MSPSEKSCQAGLVGWGLPTEIGRSSPLLAGLQVLQKHLKNLPHAIKSGLEGGKIPPSKRELTERECSLVWGPLFSNCASARPCAGMPAGPRNALPSTRSCEIARVPGPAQVRGIGAFS